MKNPRLTSSKHLHVDIKRMPLDRQGYTKGKFGKYYGVGAPLFSWSIYDDQNNEEYDGEIRAQSKKEVLDMLKSSSRTSHMFRKYANNPTGVPVGKFLPARLNANGTVTFKVPKKTVKKRTASRKKAKKTTKRKR